MNLAAHFSCTRLFFSGVTSSISKAVPGDSSFRAIQPLLYRFDILLSFLIFVVIRLGSSPDPGRYNVATIWKQSTIEQWQFCSDRLTCHAQQISRPFQNVEAEKDTRCYRERATISSHLYFKYCR